MAADLLKTIEADLERALQEYEQRGEPAVALVAYERALTDLDRLPRSADVQRLRAYALMRAANVLNELDRLDEALVSSERALIAAERSDDEIALGRAQLAQAAVQLTRRETDQGLLMLRVAAETFARDDSADHREGLAWVHIIQAETRLLGLIESEPTEIVARAEEALALLRPLASWPAIDRSHAARAVAWATYGWRETWQRFEREATLRREPVDGLATRGGERLVLFVVRVPSGPVIEGLKPLRAALAPFKDCLSLHTDHSLRIMVHPVGFLAAEVPAPGEVSRADLEELIARATAVVQGYGPLDLVLAHVNAFADEIFIEVHDTRGRLPALRDRLNHLHPSAAGGLEMIPHLTIASPRTNAPAPPPVIEALRAHRRSLIGELRVREVELITIDPYRPHLPVQSIATLPL